MERINQIGLYVRNIYELLSIGDDQLLRYWAEEYIIRTSPIDYYLIEPDYVDKAAKRFFKATTGFFAQHQKAHKNGGCFIAFSTVKRYPVSVRVHLSSVGFQKLSDRSEG